VLCPLEAQVREKLAIVLLSVMDMAIVAIPGAVPAFYCLFLLHVRGCKKTEKTHSARCRLCLYQFRVKVLWNRSLKAVCGITLLT